LSTLSQFRPAEFRAQRFAVEFEYPVIFCRDAFDTANPNLAWAIARREPERQHPLFVVVDAGVAAVWPELTQQIAAYVRGFADTLRLLAPPRFVPGGEDAKNDPALIADLQADFARAKLDRQGVLLIIGGGAVLDAVGYAGSTTHRGVRVVRMPSTVLAQNDAGIGVKTSVNAFSAKNFLGTFAPPFAVLNDASLLRTLPLRDVRAGLAEAIKVALIRDVKFFHWLEEHAPALKRAESTALEAAIRRCAELHLEHIASAGDPFEQGSARPLDYGHWCAHKLETLSQHELSHGEAVALGMALDACYAVKRGLLQPAALERICSLLEALGLRVYDEHLSLEEGGRLAILRGLQEFREHLGGTLTITLLTGLGSAVEVSEMDEGTVASAVAWLKERQTRPCSYAS